ncbi:D-alanyl-D-alanine carboxypeptidase family protein [Paenibacillus thailandensis]|uniref:D-alanyl-D-alanine carboxypeptidase family protein n=1 Tax=Paenibacillus thailandensis TaxID=393250 RepID=A0ABW5R2B6_9BACL
MAAMLLFLFIAGCESASDAAGTIEANAAEAGARTLGVGYAAVRVSPSQVHEGNLILVNRKYPIEESAMPNDIVKLAGHMERIPGIGLLDGSIRLSESLAVKFAAMTKAAEADGVHHFMINSGFRDMDEQRELYAEKGGSYALPAGYSEHNAGLSLDIGSSLAAMENAPEGRWLQDNAWKYGFVLRYPKDKTDVTGIEYEPWHFRYVGLPHSFVMKNKNMVLEEYLDYLKKERSIRVTIGDDVYTITHYPVPEEGADVAVPASGSGEYELSGDNRDGVIVTVKLPPA